jgi:hypothetical protein
MLGFVPKVIESETKQSGLIKIEKQKKTFGLDIKNLK